jgi:DNA-directed RNA polymerase specialized sigma24 family protein
MDDAPDPDVRALDAPLRHAYEAGRREYGALALPFETFAHQALARARRRLERAGVAPGRGRLEETLERTAGGDLFLALACEEDVPGAWQALIERLVPRLQQLAVRRGASPAEAEELARELPGELVAPTRERPARTLLGTYEGTGTLFSWLAGILIRRRALAARSSRTVPLAEAAGAQLDAAAPASEDPARQASDSELAEQVRSAFGEAWSALTPKEGLALLYKYRDGLPQTGIARLLDVGPPRVTRLLQQGVDKVRSALVRRLGAAAADEGPGLWTALRSAVERSLAIPGGAAQLRGGKGPVHE